MQSDDEKSITPKQVAEWMVEQLEEYNELQQQETVLEIQNLFGDEFVNPDEDGDLGISRKVLYQFKKLTGDSVVWVAMNGNWKVGFWRKRDTGDREGRKQYFY